MISRVFGAVATFMAKSGDDAYRKRFADAHVVGPHPLDCDTVDLAHFAVGWDELCRDLRVALPPERASAVEAFLVGRGVRHSFVLRNNVVAFKKVLVGIYKDGILLLHDLRRLVTFFREPPAAVAAEQPSGTGTGQGCRGFFRPSRHRELCDALGTVTGVCGALLDARKFCKAVCCVPRHPDASRSMARPFGQPGSHTRVAGVLSESLPGAFKSWRLLEEARDAPFGHAHRPRWAEKLRTCLEARATEIAALPAAEARADFDALLNAMGAIELLPEETWFVRCALIARGGAKALHVTAEAKRLTAAMRVLLLACQECHAAVALACSELHAEDPWASELRDRADVSGADEMERGGSREIEGDRGRAPTPRDVPTPGPTASVPSTASVRSPPPPPLPPTEAAGAAEPDQPEGAGAADEAEEEVGAEEVSEAEEEAEEAAEEVGAETVDVEGIEKGALLTSVARRQLGHPFIRGLIVAKKHETTLGGVRAAVAGALCWLERIAHDNADETVLFVGCDTDASRVTTSFMPNGFELPHLLEGPRAILEAHSVLMVRRLHEHGWPQWVLDAAVGGKRTSAQTCGHCGFQHSATWVRGGCCLGCEHRVRTSGRCPFGAGGGRARCTAQAWCPHAQRCLLCDGWSCAACRFHQGDGEDVASLVASLQPAAVFLDFDRTLCSTKGGSPLKGNHSIDEELVSLCSLLAGRVHVVTRNAHVDDIRTFLIEQGLADLPVHRVKRPASKAQVVCDPRWRHAGATGLGRDAGDKQAPVLFVDDNIAEHLDPEIRSAETVVRFLFAR